MLHRLLLLLVATLFLLSGLGLQLLGVFLLGCSDLILLLLVLCADLNGGLLFRHRLLLDLEVLTGRGLFGCFRAVFLILALVFVGLLHALECIVANQPGNFFYLDLIQFELLFSGNQYLQLFLVLHLQVLSFSLNVSHGFLELPFDIKLFLV